MRALFSAILPELWPELATRKAESMFTFISDPGHGWLEVTTVDLARLGLKCTDFSRCSHRRGNTLYLEEDCDAGRFIEAWRRKNGGKPELRDVYQSRTFIRDLPPIHA